MRLLAALVLAAAAAAQPTVEVVEAFPGVAFSRPVGVDEWGGRYYVTEQGTTGQSPSRIVTLREGDSAPTVFLDLTDRVRAGGEAGLLGLAFHPDYGTNGRLFVYYTAPVASPQSGVRVLESRLSEFARSAGDPLTADPASERILLRVDQPADNHNGGTVDFGPDGYLYLGLGDGGGQGDPYRNGQDLTTLLGSIVRLDVDDVPDGETYGIPADNPFAQSTGSERPEIYAWGFRNPFKFDVSPSGLWVGDVGESRWEEVDRVEKGGNYGWSEVEGPECFRAGCDPAAYAAPAHWYGHNAQGGFSITGGVAVQILDTTLDGHYLFGDFVSGRLWALSLDDPGLPPTLLFDTVPNGSGGRRAINISSIDFEGARLLVTHYGGTLYELIPGGTPAEDGPPPGALAVRVAGANPFRGATRLAVEGASGPVSAVLVDALGRAVRVLWDGPAPPASLAVEARGLAAGVYTAVVQSGDAVATQRLVVAR